MDYNTTLIQLRLAIMEHTANAQKWQERLTWLIRTPPHTLEAAAAMACKAIADGQPQIAYALLKPFVDSRAARLSDTIANALDAAEYGDLPAVCQILSEALQEKQP